VALVGDNELSLEARRVNYLCYIPFISVFPFIFLFALAKWTYPSSSFISSSLRIFSLVSFLFHSRIVGSLSPSLLQ
jgi:hypothetical protein